MDEQRTLFALLRDFWPHVSSRRRKQLVLLALLMLLGSVAELVTIGSVIPFISLMANPESAFQFPLLQRFFSLFGWQDPADIMTPMNVLFLTIITSATGIRLLLLWASNRYVYALGYDIGVSLYNRTLNQPYRYHLNTNTSEIIAAVNKVQAVLNGAVKPVLDGAIAMSLGLAIIGTLLYIQPQAMAIATGVFLGGYLAAGQFTQKRLRSNGRLIARAHTDRVRCVQEGLGGIRDIILDNSQGQITRTFARVDQRLRRGLASNSFLNQAPRYIIEAVGIFLIIGLAFFLSGQQGGLVPALPILGALALGAQRLLPLLQKVYKAWAKMTGNQQLFTDIVQMLDLTIPTRSNCGSEAMNFQRYIQLKGIRFRYEPGRQLVLDDVDLTIPKGSRIGIIGPTGSGKSTLADIIMGLLEPTEGRLLVDGIEITKLNQEAWRRCISHVPQHIFLADSSVAENIAMGVPIGRIDMDRVRESARAARIADFIEASPDGYQATVGERGIQISGGQRQRLGIARALYRNAEVLVLDEATSALDSTTESDVMNGLSETAGQVTTIMIAHRTSTLEQCDLIVKLDAGRIVSLGAYEQIMDGQSESAQAGAQSVKSN